MSRGQRHLHVAVRPRGADRSPEITGLAAVGAGLAVFLLLATAPGVIAVGATPSPTIHFLGTPIIRTVGPDDPDPTPLRSDDPYPTPLRSDDPYPTPLITAPASHAPGALESPVSTFPVNSPAPSEGPGALESPGAAGDICEQFSEGLVVRSSSPIARSGGLAAEPATPVERDLCPLPAWDGVADVSDLPGTVAATSAFYVSDPTDDMNDPEANIIGVGVVPVSLSSAQAKQIVKSGAFSTRGTPSKVIKAGKYRLIHVLTSERPASAPGRNLSFHVATDRQGDRSRDIPTSVAQPMSPLRGERDAYSVIFGAGAAKPGLYSTDFAGKQTAGSAWYNDTAPFAARVTDSPAGIQYLVPEKGLGPNVRVISYTDEDGATPRQRARARRCHLGTT